LLLDCPALFDRPGNPYLDANGEDWTDNHPFRPAVACCRPARPGRIAARLAGRRRSLQRLADRPRPAWLHYEGGAASVVTVHNIAFQGCFGRDMLGALGLPEHAWRFDHVEYHGQLSFLKAGLQLASRLSTVSPTYAREIQDEHFGYGLAPAAPPRRRPARHPERRRYRHLEPATDPALAAGYAANRLAAKRANKTALQAKWDWKSHPTARCSGSSAA
jgi:starch synthase